MYQDINRNTRQLFIFSFFIVFMFLFGQEYSEIIPGQKLVVMVLLEGLSYF